MTSNHHLAIKSLSRGGATAKALDDTHARVLTRVAEAQHARATYASPQLAHRLHRRQLLSAAAGTMRVELIGHFKPCMAEIYLLI